MDKYILSEKIGQGLLGQVFKAHNIETKQECAVKIIPLVHPIEDPEEVLKELSPLKAWDSRCIIKYHDLFLAENKLWIVTDYISAGSLQDYLVKVGVVSEPYISSILREILSGLRYLHNEKRGHRHLKASNILITDKGEIKLCDISVGEVLTDLTKLKCAAQSPYWTPPEVIVANGKRERADKQDIWALGITAYELATGTIPYMASDPIKANLMIVNDDPPRLEGDSFSLHFKDFLNLCLTKEAKKRPSARELLDHPFVRKGKKKHTVFLIFLVNFTDDVLLEKVLVRNLA
eukprot:TRINITY_DN18231_c0_g1_i1.p1 TRINITY_DN18231_c0_g1~~TRINITY_DN18231_c0_g1_i1.p1  ORF type:complete len:318 (+),score=41.27 TRINITY_DN18231_c0_g1_i1:82-954(+)